MQERREIDREGCEEVVAIDTSMFFLPLISEACLSRCGKTNRTRVDCQHVLCARQIAAVSNVHEMIARVDDVACTSLRRCTRSSIASMRTCIMQSPKKNRLQCSRRFQRYGHARFNARRSRSSRRSRPDSAVHRVRRGPKASARTASLRRRRHR